MNSLPELEQALNSLSSLTRVLGEEHTGMALVCADGTWHLEQNGAVRHQKTALPTTDASALVEAVDRFGPTGCLEHWWVRSVTSESAPTVLFERRPTSESDGLSRLTLDLLRTRLDQGANGLIFGNSRTARSGILLSLTRFLPTDLVLYVGPVPPIEPEGTSLLHINPPRHDRDRRELATLFDRASAVLFDGPVQPADIRLLFSGSDLTDRWLAVDATNPVDWLSEYAVNPRQTEPLTTRIGVRGSPAKTVRLTYFARRSHEKWQILLDQDNLHHHDSDGDISSDPVSDEKTVADGDRLSKRLTSPIDHGTDPVSDNAPTKPETPSVTTDSGQPSPHSELQANAIADAEAAAESSDENDFDVQSLISDEDSEPTEIPRESGEIDVPGFVSRRQRQARDESEDIADAPTDMLKGERIDGDLPGLVASSDIDQVEIPGIAPEQLRRTFESPVDVDSLQKQRDAQRREQHTTPSSSISESSEPSDDDPPRDESSSSSHSSRHVSRSKSADQSSSNISTSNSWSQSPSTGHRVIPVPTNTKRTESATAELGKVQSADLDSTDPEADEDPTDELLHEDSRPRDHSASDKQEGIDSEPITTEVPHDEEQSETTRTGISEAHADVLEKRLSDSVDHTEEVDIGDVLEDLRQKRAQGNSSDES